MKAYVALLVLACAAYCHAADKNYGDYCGSSDKCLEDTTCRIWKGCTYGRCYCKKSGYTQDGTTNKCKKMAKYDEACTDNSDCYTGLCTSNKCACSSGFQVHSNKMECGKYVGKSCTTATVSTDCGSYMTCSSSKCACQTGYKEEDMKCTTYYLGEDCSGGKNCRSPGTCQSNKCSCSSSLVAYLKRYCVHKDATLNVAEGQTCKGSGSAADDKLCKEGLACRNCPDANGASTSTLVCAGAASIEAGVLTAAFAAFTAVLAYFRL